MKQLGDEKWPHPTGSLPTWPVGWRFPRQQCEAWVNDLSLEMLPNCGPMSNDKILFNFGFETIILTHVSCIVKNIIVSNSI